METRVHQAPVIYRARKKRKYNLKKIGYGLLALLLLYFALFLLVVPERPTKPFFEGERPYVIAHLGGASYAPENTLAAIEKSKSLGVDVIHFTVRLTKDGQLVLLLDETIDRTTNGEGRVDELTLNELKSFDAAYRYRDIRGRYMYRGQDIKIPTIDEVFQTYGNMRFNIELLPISSAKDKKEEKEVSTNSAKEDLALEKVLWNKINLYKMKDKVLVYSRDHKIYNRFKKLANNEIALSAPQSEVNSFVIYHKLFLNRLYKPKSDAFQIPDRELLFNLKEWRIINGAKTLNMPILYQVINDETTMKDLLERGADGIITDRPDLLIRLKKELEVTNEED